MTVENGKRKSFIDKLIYAFKPRPAHDIVTCAEKIIDDYTGLTALRYRRRERRMKRFLLVLPALCVFTLLILICVFKIFF